MKAAYIVVEGKQNANLLKQMLPVNFLPNIEIIGMSSWYAAFSLASTIMSERSRPVILIVNAQSNDSAHIQERIQNLESLMLPASSSAPYKAIVAVPSIEAIAQEFHQAESTIEINENLLIQQITQFLSTASLSYSY